MEWKPVLYNGHETNVEVTKCGKVRRVPKEWYGKGKGAYKIKYGEVDFSQLKLNKGYKQIAIIVKDLKQKNVFVHQLVASSFLDYKFKFNKVVIDHIDSNPLNNNIDNLRIITQRENLSKERTIKSKLPVGVYFNKKIKKYKSSIFINNKRYHLGTFNNPEEASEAYQNKLNNL